MRASRSETEWWTWIASTSWSPTLDQRMQRGERVLEDVGDPVAADLPQAAVLGADQVLAVEADRAAGDDARRRGDEADDARAR